MNNPEPDFENVFKSLPDYSLILLPDSPKFTIVGINKKVVSDLPDPSISPIGNGLFDFFEHQSEQSLLSDAGLVKSVLQKTLDEKLVQVFFVNRIIQSCQYFLLLKFTPVLDSRGEINYIIYSIINLAPSIDDIHNITKSISNKKAYHLLMQAPIAICLLHPKNYTIEAINQYFLSLWGRKDEIRGKTIFEIIPEISEDIFLPCVENISSKGRAQVNEIQVNIIKNEANELVYVNFICQPYFDESDQLAGILVIATNITDQVNARRKAEKIRDELNFQNALLIARSEMTPDGLLVVDAKGSIITYNKRFAEIWKMPKEILESKDDKAALEHAMTQLIDPQPFIDRVNYFYSHPDEKSNEELYFKDGRVIETHGLSIIGEDGTYYGWSWYFRDITERFTHLFAVEKVRQKVASDLHDDIGATLTAIGLLSEVAKTKIDTNLKEAKELIEKISNNSLTMMEAMSDIVWSINPNNDSMQKTIVRMREYATTLLDTKGIEYNCIIEEKVEQVVLNTEARLDLFLIFKEAVNNLVKYSKCTHALIKIIIEDDLLNMLIKDNGVGFNINHHRDGNGLENIRFRARRIGAAIDIQSTINLGTTVTLLFPLPSK